MRTAAAIIAGILIAIIVQSGADILISQIYPTAVTNMWDRAQVNEAFAARPANALLLGIAGFLLGGLAGGAAGKLIGGRASLAWPPALVLAAMAALLGLNFPLPGWAAMGMVAAALVGALLANHLVAARPAPAAVVEPS